MPILFFDTFIVAGYGPIAESNVSAKRKETLDLIRSAHTTYRYQNKIDVVKYTLSSYSVIPWDNVIIRFECEDISQTDDFFSYCKFLFPSAKIVNERSSTAFAYSKSLKEINAPKDSWVFFSPNNDHPFLVKPSLLIDFIQAADSFLANYPKVFARLLYSHYTESVNDYLFQSPQWGYYADIFKQLIYKDDAIIVTRANKVSNDSIMLFRLNDLINFFSRTKNTGRVIRLEDTEFYIYPDSDAILIVPTTELCRHYDSYTHIMNFVPPLFIPEGFFESNIRIRYGYREARDGWINIDPFRASIDNNCDLWCLLEDLPFFWMDKISCLDINPCMPHPRKSQLIAYINFTNPWHSRSLCLNILRSSYISLTFPLRKFRSYLIFFARIIRHYVKRLFYL